MNICNKKVNIQQAVIQIIVYTNTFCVRFNIANSSVLKSCSISVDGIILLRLKSVKKPEVSRNHVIKNKIFSNRFIKNPPKNFYIIIYTSKS